MVAYHKRMEKAKDALSRLNCRYVIVCGVSLVLFVCAFLKRNVDYTA